MNHGWLAPLNALALAAAVGSLASASLAARRNAHGSAAVFRRYYIRALDGGQEGLEVLTGVTLAGVQ
jgi:hypothetical protein